MTQRKLAIALISAMTGLAGAVVFWAYPLPVAAQTANADFQALLQDTQRVIQEPSGTTMVWWMPDDYWRVTLAQTPGVTKEDLDKFIESLSPYTVIVAVHAKVSAMGTVTYESEADLRGSIRLTDNRGSSYSPLPEEKINEEARKNLAQIRPSFGQMAGPMGQNMYIFVFPGTYKLGGKIADPRKDGAFNVKLGEKQFRWRLPLGSLMPPKVCPKCNEKLSGAFKFCPYDGTQLPATEE
jgi:hypothetical protein